MVDLLALDAQATAAAAAEKKKKEAAQAAATGAAAPANTALASGVSTASGAPPVPAAPSGTSTTSGMASAIPQNIWGVGKTGGFASATEASNALLAAGYSWDEAKPLVLTTLYSGQVPPRATPATPAPTAAPAAPAPTIAPLAPAPAAPPPTVKPGDINPVTGLRTQSPTTWTPEQMASYGYGNGNKPAGAPDLSSVAPQFGFGSLNQNPQYVEPKPAGGLASAGSLAAAGIDVRTATMAPAPTPTPAQGMAQADPARYSMTLDAVTPTRGAFGGLNAAGYDGLVSGAPVTGPIALTGGLASLPTSAAPLPTAREVQERAALASLQAGAANLAGTTSTAINNGQAPSVAAGIIPGLPNNPGTGAVSVIRGQGAGEGTQNMGGVPDVSTGSTPASTGNGPTVPGASGVSASSSPANGSLPPTTNGTAQSPAGTPATVPGAAPQGNAPAALNTNPVRYSLADAYQPNTAYQAAAPVAPPPEFTDQYAGLSSAVGGLANPYTADYQARLAGQAVDTAEEQYRVTAQRLQENFARRGIGGSGAELGATQDLAMQTASARTRALNDAMLRTTELGANFGLSKAQGQDSFGLNKAQGQQAYQAAAYQRYADLNRQPYELDQLKAQAMGAMLQNEASKQQIQQLAASWPTIQKKEQAGLALTEAEVAQKQWIAANSGWLAAAGFFSNALGGVTGLAGSLGLGGK